MTRNKKRQTTNQLRIIGGEFRGRKLQFPDALHLRPTADRIRETVFNWLQTSVIGADCLDLFAGSGALGLEALSRGASYVTFIDVDKNVVRQLKANCAMLKCENVEVKQTDALQLLSSQAMRQYSLVFVDPPFQIGSYASVVQQLTDNGWLAERAKIYLECAADLALPTMPESWVLLKDKTAGQVRYQLYEYVV